MRWYSLQSSLNHLQNTPNSTNPPISTIFSMSNLTLLLVLLLPLLLNAPTIHSRLKITDRSFTHHARFSEIGFLKNLVNLSCILHSPLHLTPQHLFLFYPHLFFPLSSKLTSSANHFLLSMFHSHLDG